PPYRHQTADHPKDGERDSDQEHDPVPVFDRPDAEEQEQQHIQDAETGDPRGGYGEHAQRPRSLPLACAHSSSVSTPCSWSFPSSPSRAVTSALISGAAACGWPYPGGAVCCPSS